MNTAPENMSSRTAAAWIVVLTVLGGATGFAWGGPFLAVACGLSLAAAVRWVQFCRAVEWSGPIGKAGARKLSLGMPTGLRR